MKTIISIAGDLFLLDSFRNNVSINENIKSLFSKSDLTIVNLEAPVTEELSDSYRIKKDGPHLRMGEWVLDLIISIGVNAVCLANNHIMDYGSRGLSSTIELCDRNDLIHFGAGANASEAAVPFIREINGKRIGFIAVCENEWSVATSTSPGANGFDLIDNYSSIIRAKENCDVVIVIVHGGNEHYHLPSPRVKKAMRFFIDIGADAVVMHHSHCVSGMELYNGNPIFYGLGNFFFTSHGRSEGWYQGAILNLVIGEDNSISWKVNFVNVTSDCCSASLASSKLESQLNKDFIHLSEKILNDESLATEWSKFVEEASPFYYQVFSVLNLLPFAKLRGLARRLGLSKYVLPRRHLVHLINYVTCESHLDISRAVLLNRLKD